MARSRQQGTLVSSFERLQRLLPGILEEHGDNQQLVLAALANPILALEHLGYSFPPDVRDQIALRVRFGEEQAKTLRSLRAAVHEAAGEVFDLDSPAELRRVLRRLFESTAPKQARQRKPAEVLDRDVVPPLPRLGWAKSTEDPLQEYAQMHPVMKPLLAYRGVEASEPRLASEAVFQEVLDGKRVIPASHARFRLQNPGGRRRRSR
jgi:hypothetical protein